MCRTLYTTMVIIIMLGTELVALWLDKRHTQTKEVPPIAIQPHHHGSNILARNRG